MGFLKTVKKNISSSGSPLKSLKNNISSYGSPSTSVMNNIPAPQSHAPVTSGNNSDSLSSRCPTCSEIPPLDISIANEKYPIICSTKGCEFNNACICSPCLTTMLSNVFEDGGGLELRQVTISSDEAMNDAHGTDEKVNDTNENDLTELLLNCPKCIKPFCVSVEDVLMLRRAIVWRRTLSDMRDEELSASELREKYHWDETRLAELKLAEARYAIDFARE